jgi:hypothetical protein
MVNARLRTGAWDLDGMVNEGFVAGKQGALDACLVLRALDGLRQRPQIGLGLLLRRP